MALLRGESSLKYNNSGFSFKSYEIPNRNPSKPYQAGLPGESSDKLEKPSSGSAEFAPARTLSRMVDASGEDTGYPALIFHNTRCYF
jgi:hypothetical protein